MNPKLDRLSPIPIYQQIVNWMRAQIADGIWPEHFQLRSEIELAQELGVNRGTLRNAIETLVDEGLLLRIHGKGTFVAAKVLEQPLAESLMTFSESLIDQNIPFETQVLGQRVAQPDALLASLLALDEGATVFALTRVRRVNGKPIIFLKNYVSYRYCPGIEAVDFVENRLFDVLEKQFGLRIAWGRRYFEARIADAEIAALLEINPGDPVMYTQQIVSLDNGEPLEMSDIWINARHFRVSAIVKRDHDGQSLSIIGSAPEYIRTEINL
ncbi:MAG TPA: GntR family transcriptional regulator [Phototrophicaceae bacterium]|nr:GntR family transcriptional regulator [Phototrophicaceae bacterium]